jgi:hypothetical protein
MTFILNPVSYRPDRAAAKPGKKFSIVLTIFPPHHPFRFDMFPRLTPPLINAKLVLP